MSHNVQKKLQKAHSQSSQSTCTRPTHSSGGRWLVVDPITGRDTYNLTGCRFKWPRCTSSTSKEEGIYHKTGQGAQFIISCCFFFFVVVVLLFCLFVCISAFVFLNFNLCFVCFALLCRRTACFQDVPEHTFTPILRCVLIYSRTDPRGFIFYLRACLGHSSKRK